jgi:chemotaxis protein CheX
MDANLINPILTTMVNVLSTMAQLQPSMGKPTLKESDAALGEVTGMMKMQSPQMNGSFSITFTAPAILDIAKRMLGEEITEVNDMAKDLAGEVTNMVVGGAKNIYVEQGYDFNMSTPNILAGKDHKVEHGCSGKTIVLPFEAGGHKFFVEMCFDE